MRPVPGAALAATLLAAAACHDPRPTEAPAAPRPAPTPAPAPAPAPAAPVAYVVSPPPGKLPWPQHDPAFTQARYETMLRELFIANNFGLFQAGAEPSTAYLHHGLDIVLPNWTPLFAVKSGTVRHINDSPLAENYKSVVIQDEDSPETGWSYVHVDSFRVKVGDYVPQGTRIASVKFFAGPYEHVHLDRVRVRPGAGWSVYNQTASQPDTFFVYGDTQAPVFFEPALFYFRNQTDSAFSRPPGAGRVTLSGDVDLVVGVRDPSEHGHSVRVPVDDRWAPARLEYAIAPLGGTAPRRKSWDFRTLEIVRTPEESPAALTVFKFYRAVIPSNRPSPQESRMAFYILTNVPEGGRAGPIATADAALSWRTAELLPDGTRRYPDGEYVVTVWAHDFKGNVASRSDTVRVRN